MLVDIYMQIIISGMYLLLYNGITPFTTDRDINFHRRSVYGGEISNIIIIIVS